MFDLRRLALGTRERIAGAVYGTIVVLAVLTAGASAYAHDLWRLGAIVTAIGLLVILGFACLAVDVGYWQLAKSKTQGSADSAAAAAGITLRKGGNLTSATTQAM